MVKTHLEDIIYLILSCLPVKSLVRFTCVSKSWAALIYSSSFAKSHLKQSTITKPVMDILLGDEGYSVKLNQYPDDEDENSGCDIVVEEIEYPFSPYPLGMDYFHIVSSCNGLLYLVNESSSEDAVLFNPLTRTYCKIPNITRVEAQLSSERLDGGIRQFPSCSLSSTDWFFSCVYDEVNDDYKVVGIRVKKHMRDRVTSSWIYSTKSGIWRRTADQFPSYNIAARQSGTYVYNALHWVLCNHEYDPNYVAALDVVTEKFCLLPLPLDCHLNEYSALNLGVLDGCLCLSCYSSKYDYHFFEVWIMREYGTENFDRLMKLRLHIDVDRLIELGLDYSDIVEMKALALSENGKLLLVYIVKQEELPYVVEEEEEEEEEGTKLEAGTKFTHTLALYDVETGSRKSEFNLPDSFVRGDLHLHIPSLVNPKPRACN